MGVRDIVLVGNNSPDSQAAREFLRQCGIGFSEVSADIARNYPSPTLLVYGWAYFGLAEIKHGALTDMNID